MLLLKNIAIISGGTIAIKPAMKRLLKEVPSLKASIQKSINAKEIVKKEAKSVTFKKIFKKVTIYDLSLFCLIMLTN